MARVAVPVTQIAPSSASLTTACAGTNNDLVYTAKTAGPGGNQTRVAYIVSGANTPLTVAVTGFDITVNVATNGSSVATSTSAQVKTAVEGNTDAARLVIVTHAASNNGTGVVAAFSITALAGGGLGITPVTATDGDATNMNYLTNNDGQVYLEVVSSDASSRTVTFYYAPNVLPGVTVGAVVETVAAGATRLLGPFPPGRFNQNAAKDVYFDPSVSTTLKFRAYRLTSI